MHSDQAGHLRLDQHLAQVLLAQIEELRLHFKQVKKAYALAEIPPGADSVGLLRR